MLLSRVIGPECPHCACPMGEVLEERETRRGVMLRIECDYCHRIFRAMEVEQVQEPEQHHPDPDDALVLYEYPPDAKKGATCPTCKARPVWVIGHAGKDPEGRKIRRHECKCGHKFRSIDAGS